MGAVARFGSDDDDNPEVAAIEQRAGGPDDIAHVNTLAFETVRSCLALWTAGANYADIARQMHLRSPKIAQMAVERALADMVDDHSDKSKLRRRMSLTLDRFLKAITPKAVDPEHPEQLAAVRTGLSIVDRYSKLNGLDAPVQVDIHMPSGEQFETFIALAARGAGIEVPIEADPFDTVYEIEDAEVVEDENDDESGA